LAAQCRDVACSDNCAAISEAALDDTLLGKEKETMNTLIKILIVIIITGMAIFFGWFSAKAFGDATRPVEVNVPFAYDVNVCDGEIVAWAYSEPNVPIYYSCFFYTKSGRPANPLWVQLDHSQQPLPLTILYHGRTRIDPNDPNAPGFWHEWTVAYVPMYEGIHHVNITATYGPRNSSAKAFRQTPGPKEQDTRTVVYNVIQGDSPFLMNGDNPSPIEMGQKQMTFQYAMKRKSLYFGINQPVLP